MYIRCSVIIFLSILLAACSPNAEKADTTVFHLNLVGGLESLDPAFAKDLSTMWCAHALFNTLVESDSQSQLIPSLASRWEISSDGLVYRFTLRNDVFFHDNPLFAHQRRKMTAADVVYSFNRLIDPATASTGAWIFNGRVREQDPFVAINDTTVEIHLAKPFRPLLEILTMPYCSIIPKEVVTHWGKDFRNHPCGTGPFQFHYWDEGNVLVFYKNPTH